MPLRIQTLGNTSLRCFTEILMPPCVLLLMIIGWSAIFNHNCNFPEVFLVIILNFHLSLDLLLVGFTIQFPDFMVLVFLVCWECTPSIVVSVVSAR